MPQKFKTDKPTVDEILSLKKPNRRFVDILLDPTLFNQVQEKQKAIRLAEGKKMRGPDLSQKSVENLTAELADLLELAAEHSVVFVFQDIGKRKYDQLQDQYPATEEQQKAWKEEGQQGRLAYDTEKFIPVLIAACSVTLTDEEEEIWRESGGRGTLSPAISLSQAEQIFNEWSEGDIEALFFGAYAACKEKTSIPLSKRDIAPTPDSNSNSITPLNGESPTQPS